MNRTFKDRWILGVVGVAACAVAALRCAVAADAAAWGAQGFAIGLAVFGACLLVAVLVPQRRRVPIVDRRGWSSVCTIHVFTDAVGVIHSTLIPAPFRDDVDWLAVGDAVSDAARRIDAGVGEATSTRLT